ncbi:MAG: universal stress protein [Candidatus Binatia bacterium]
MYTRILIPLDGSKTAEKVLPYARTLAGRLKIPVELLSVIDIAALASQTSAEKARYLDRLVEDGVRSSETYLKEMGRSFPGLSVKCTVEKGRAEEVIIEKGASDAALTAMATHGRSGIDRWLLGSVAEKVLRGATNPLLLVRASEQAKSGGEAALKSVIVPLDGSALGDSIIPHVVELAKALQLEILLVRAYQIPVTTYAGVEDYYAVNYDEIREALRDEGRSYLEKRIEELKRAGIERVSLAAPEGYAPDEIISLGRKTPDNLIAMCTHGRSGVTRWVLGSVTETVVRHSGDPVLVIRSK